MFVDTSIVSNKKKTKSYKRVLLRESFRENGKVKHRTVANLSHCSQEEIDAIQLALRHKDELQHHLDKKLKDISVTSQQGLSMGAVWTIHEIAKRLGIIDALGATPQGKLALWQVIARVIDQGSRLSATRLATSHAACDILGMDPFNEEHLYRNLVWLLNHQREIEDTLYAFNCRKAKGEGLYLYDVTSSYFEGEKNELGAFGYNRDKKRGKRQIVIGLLCDENGDPISIEVFPGNTTDQQTFGSQLKKVSERFSGKIITLVGDRGMIKGPQQTALMEATEEGQKEGGDGKSYYYITAITKAQIESLMTKGVLQLTLFDESLCEVKTNEGVRYILRRNPVRAKEIQRTREDKFQVLIRAMGKKNSYLKEHEKAKGETAERALNALAKKLKVTDLVKITLDGTNRQLSVSKDEGAQKEAERLDGCYAIKTDLTQEQASKEIVHDRYKDLSKVELAFRTSKTAFLEMRPIYLRKEKRTRGHALVVMLAYKIIRELTNCWRGIDITVEEGIYKLSQVCSTYISLNGATPIHQIPTPRADIQELLTAAKVVLPEVFPVRHGAVATRQKLQSRRNLP
jgi:transposase